MHVDACCTLWLRSYLPSEFPSNTMLTHFSSSSRADAGSLHPSHRCSPFLPTPFRGNSSYTVVEDNFESPILRLKIRLDMKLPR